MRARFSCAERETLRVDRARGRNLYFRNVMRCRCKIWNINASRHSHNRPRTNQTVRSVLFLFQCVFIVRRMVPASFPSKFSLLLPLSLSISFSLICTPIQNGSRGRNRCYYNAATSSQSLVVEVQPSFNILRSVSMRWSQSIWTAKRAAIAYRLN